jgi:hypothetical protein
MMGWEINNELYRIRKEAAIAQCEELSQHLFGRAEKNREMFNQISRRPGRG